MNSNLNNNVTEAASHGGGVTCPICGTNFAIPGFNAAQSARFLHDHIQANHPTSEQTRLNTANSADNAVDAVRNDIENDTEDNAIDIGNDKMIEGVVPVDEKAVTFSEPAAIEDSEDRPDLRDKRILARAPETDARQKRWQKPKQPDRNSAPKPTNPESDHRSQKDHSGAENAGTAWEMKSNIEGTQNMAAKTVENGKQTGKDTGNTKPSERPKQTLIGKPTPKVTPKPAQQTQPDKTAANKISPNKKPASKAGRLAEGAAETAAASVGVPPAVTRVVIRVARKYLPTTIVLISLVFGSLFAGFFADDAVEDRIWDVTATDQYDIPAPYLDAYQEAASQYDVPWTLLAAIGAAASFHGRINPYLQPVPSPANRQGETDIKAVYLIGDSLGRGMEARFRGLLEAGGITYDPASVSEDSQRTEWGVQRVKEQVPDANRMVVSLGTNDPIGVNGAQAFTKEIDRFMSVVQQNKTVYWLTIDKQGAEPLNKALRSAANKWGNLRIIEWARDARARGATTDADPEHLHYTPAGNDIRAEYVYEALTGITMSGGSATDGTLTGPGVLPTPTGNCPTLSSPIEGAARTQGAGPLMLKPSILDALGIELGDNINNICASANALAQILADTARTLTTDDGVTFPRGIALLAQQAAQGDADATNQVHQFWAQVVDQAAVLGTVAEAVCSTGEQGGLSDQDYTGASIYAYWLCALNNSTNLHSLDAVTVGDDGMPTYSELSTPAAVVRGVEEALSVAWTWSNWGANECDPTAEVAGVFPLTATVFNRYKSSDYQGKDRCDKEANIATAAAAYSDFESEIPELRSGPWNATRGGWRNFAYVGGPTTAGIFNVIGPWTPLQAGTTCSQLLVNGVAQAGDDTTLFPEASAITVQNYLITEMPAEIMLRVDTKLVDVVQTSIADPKCGVDRPRTTAEWLAVTAGAYSGDMLTGVNGPSGTAGTPKLTIGNTSGLAGRGDIAAVLAARAYTLATEQIAVATVGQTALLARLWSEQITVPVHPTLSRGTGENNLSFGSHMVNIAVGYYGGLFVDEIALIGNGFGLVGGQIEYADIFNRMGQKYGVDPRLLAAIAKAESNFNPDAGCPYDRSVNTAAGMMQKENDLEDGTLCGNIPLQVETAAQALQNSYNAAGDWVGAIWGYNNGIRFSVAWKDFPGDRVQAEAYAKNYYCEVVRFADCDGRAEIAMSYISDDPAVRSAYIFWLDYQRIFPGLAISSTQMTVSATNCPKTRPSQMADRPVLRGGADAIGMYDLCAASVAQASSPAAALAIIFAFNNLGIIYDQSLRDSYRFDCSSYVSRAYQSGGVLMSADGWSYTTRTLLPLDPYTRPEWIVPIAAATVQPGDLVFPYAGHVAMILADGYIIHTDRRGDVSKVERMPYANPLQYNRIVPALAPASL